MYLMDHGHNYYYKMTLILREAVPRRIHVWYE